MGFRRVFLLFLTIAALAPAALLWGRTGLAYIDSVQLRRGGRSDVLLSFRVQRAFDERLVDTLDSGLPVRFTYLIQVVKPRELFADVVVADLQLDRTLVKDNLKDRYKVTFGSSRENRDLPTLADAVEAMSRVDSVRILSLDALSRSGPLLLKIKAKLQKFQLPFHLHYLFAFVSMWDVETDWYVLELPPSAEGIP